MVKLATAILHREKIITRIAKVFTVFTFLLITSLGFSVLTSIDDFIIVEPYSSTYMAIEDLKGYITNTTQLTKSDLDDFLSKHPIVKDELNPFVNMHIKESILKVANDYTKSTESQHIKYYDDNPTEDDKNRVQQYLLNVESEAIKRISERRTATLPDGLVSNEESLNNEETLQHREFEALPNSASAVSPSANVSSSKQPSLTRLKECATSSIERKNEAAGCMSSNNNDSDLTSEENDKLLKQTIHNYQISSEDHDFVALDTIKLGPQFSHLHKNIDTDVFLSLIPSLVLESAKYENCISKLKRQCRDCHFNQVGKLDGLKILGKHVATQLMHYATGYSHPELNRRMLLEMNEIQKGSSLFCEVGINQTQKALKNHIQKLTSTFFGENTPAFLITDSKPATKDLYHIITSSLLEKPTQAYDTHLHDNIKLKISELIPSNDAGTPAIIQVLLENSTETPNETTSFCSCLRCSHEFQTQIGNNVLTKWFRQCLFKENINLKVVKHILSNSGMSEDQHYTLISPAPSIDILKIGSDTRVSIHQKHSILINQGERDSSIRPNILNCESNISFSCGSFEVPSNNMKNQTVKKENIKDIRLTLSYGALEKYKKHRKQTQQ